MRLVKLLGSLLPLGWIGWLLWMFLKPYLLSETPAALAPAQVMNDGLGPTVIGLGMVALLLCIPVLIRLFQLAMPRPAKIVRAAVAAQDSPAFDPDAALERYLARKEAGLVEPIAWPGADTEGPARSEAPSRPSFGRKTA